MIRLIISQHFMEKTEWSRPMLESCMRTLERRCAFAVGGPAQCRIRISREHGDGHSPCPREPLQIVAQLDLSIPGRGKHYIARCAAEHPRSAVGGAVEAIEKMLRREAEKHVSARRSRKRSRRFEIAQLSPEEGISEELDQTA